MAKEQLVLTIEVNNDAEAYFAINKLTTVNFLTGVKVIQAKYKGKTHTFDSKKKRKDFLKGKTEKD